MPTRLAWLSCVLVLAVAADGAAQSRDLSVDPMGGERRVALVIGNAAYSASPLRNPVNDAREIARTVKELGFDVVTLENASQKNIRRAVLDFGNRLRNGGVGLFYYAGHGVQAAGRNYMVPVDATIVSEPEVEIESVDVASVLAQMERAGNRLNIVILDACRNNPFGRSFRTTASGLASIDAPAGTMIAYATAPGRVARDGDGLNSPYTAELVKAMRVPGLSIENMFKRVRQAVATHTQNAQVPWESSSLVGEFVFALPARSAEAPVASPVGQPPQIEIREEVRHQLGSLAISGPDGVEVWLDEQRIGETRPGRAFVVNNVPAGTRRVRASKPGYQDWLREVSVAANQQADVRIELKPVAQPSPPAPVTASPPGPGAADPTLAKARELLRFRDYAAAAPLLQRAATGGSAEAMRHVASLYDRGLGGLDKSDRDAVTWYRKAADAGDGHAMNQLGYAHASGRGGLAKDDVEAVRWYRKGASTGDGLAMANLAYMYETGRGGLAKDDAEAMRWYRKGAEAGEGSAMANLGYMYETGRGGLVKDDAGAVRWYRKGADAGSGAAMANLGLMHANGRGGLQKDDAEAVRWYRRGAEAGRSRAMTRLGLMYANGGGGLAKDDAEAVRWFRKGADAGDGAAMANLGLMHETGRGGGAKDDAEAVRWYRKGAGDGDGLAMTHLGDMYAAGRGGLEKNDAEAVRWYRKGAEAGDARAMTSLGFMYETGRAGVRNPTEAASWYRRAAEAGDARGKERLERLGRR